MQKVPDDCEDKKHKTTRKTNNLIRLETINLGFFREKIPYMPTFRHQS